MYAPCRRQTALMLRAAWLATSFAGPCLLPGHRFLWQPPVGVETWNGILEQLSARFGPFDTWALYNRTQAGRPGISALLLRNGKPLCFLRVTSAADPGPAREFNCLKMVSSFRPRSFAVVEPLLLEDYGELKLLALSPLPSRPHYVAKHPPIEVIAQEIGAALSSFPRSNGVPSDWRPMHGDFAPWNLRSFGRAGLFLLDWESVGWAPPGADEVFYRAAAATLGFKEPGGNQFVEAIDFWAKRFAGPNSEIGRDRELEGGFSRALANMLGPGGVSTD